MSLAIHLLYFFRTTVEYIDLWLLLEAIHGYVSNLKGALIIKYCYAVLKCMVQYTKYTKENENSRDNGDFHMLSIPDSRTFLLVIKQQDGMFISLHLCYQANGPCNLLTLLDVVKQDLCLSELLPW